MGAAMTPDVCVFISTQPDTPLNVTVVEKGKYLFSEGELKISKVTSCFHLW
jgi:hypothetical protein